MDIQYVYQYVYSIARPSKIYPNLDFWFENIPSRNPGQRDEASFFNQTSLLGVNFVPLRVNIPPFVHPALGVNTLSSVQSCTVASTEWYWIKAYRQSYAHTSFTTCKTSYRSLVFKFTTGAMYILKYLTHDEFFVFLI
jgi:hypothetical protein